MFHQVKERVEDLRCERHVFTVAAQQKTPTNVYAKVAKLVNVLFRLVHVALKNLQKL